MSKKKSDIDLYLKGDPAILTKAVEGILRAGYPLRRTTEYQLKIGPWNFYPGTGSIQHDGKKKEPVRGLDALLKLLDADASLPQSNDGFERLSKTL